MICKCYGKDQKCESCWGSGVVYCCDESGVRGQGKVWEEKAREREPVEYRIITCAEFMRSLKLEPVS